MGTIVNWIVKQAFGIELGARKNNAKKTISMTDTSENEINLYEYTIKLNRVDPTNPTAKRIFELVSKVRSDFIDIRTVYVSQEKRCTKQRDIIKGLEERCHNATMRATDMAKNVEVAEGERDRYKTSHSVKEASIANEYDSQIRRLKNQIEVLQNKLKED